MLRPAAWLALAVALAGPGCAALSEHRARGKLLRTELEDFHYRQPLAAVWPEVRRLLVDRGLKLAGQDAAAVGQSSGMLAPFTSAAKETRTTPSGGAVLETGWDERGQRWRAEAEPGARGLRVVLTRVEANLDHVGLDGATERDYELELDLLRRVDPEAAFRIDDLISPPSPAAGKRP